MAPRGSRLRSFLVLAIAVIQVLPPQSRLTFTPSRNQGWGQAGRTTVARAAVLDVTTAEELDEAIARTAREDSKNRVWQSNGA
eukprot:g6653.t1